jgi:ABC-type glycerol-3-phosphate transport system substrate-binding protein
LMVSKYSTKKDEAIEFIKFLQRDTSQKIMFTSAGYAPVIQKVYADSEFTRQEPDLLFYKNLFTSGFHRPYLADYTKISDILSYYLHQAIIKELTVADALRTATRQVNSNQVLIK